MTSPVLPAWELKYLAAYPESTRKHVRVLVEQNRLAEVLTQKYPMEHGIKTDKALYEFVLELKSEYLRSSHTLNKVLFDSKIQVIKHALGLHTTISRVQGNKLKTKREIRVAALFKEVPVEFLRMIVVHELAHFKERQHDKAFYQLCQSMEPAYHQFEFDLRLYLIHLELFRTPLWQSTSL
ncbi:MAG TPA: YgjP-like metallopeptidase domain-containing protein [Methylophilaceae bacterium]|nr:YgjP-like metallopeptidase domain-containing protein [Methylophilaceae bacterium]